MRVWTIKAGQIWSGATVVPFTLANGTAIPSIVVGEKGRGRCLGVVPVDRAKAIPCPDRGKRYFFRRPIQCEQCGVTAPEGIHPMAGVIYERIRFAALRTSRSGRPKLVAQEAPGPDSQEKAVLVFRTPFGTRGSNFHSGDLTDWWCGCGGKGSSWTEGCTECGQTLSIHRNYGNMPGEVLAYGVAAEGEAGKSGNGSQYVLIAKVGDVIRTVYGGRWSGEPFHCYKILADQILVATLKDRVAGNPF